MEKIIFQTISGNVIGVVVRPAKLRRGKPRKEQYIVKIGVIDRDGPLPEADAVIVINNLRDFAVKL